MQIDELKKIVQDSGVVGAGGAGFPTHVKLSKGADTIILNCAECEPLFQVDKQLLSVHTDKILKTFSMIVDTLDAKQGIIAVKASFKDAIKEVESIIYRYSNLELKLLKETYPAGDEVILVYETTGRIVPEGKIPMSVFVTVMNVETVLNIFNAVELNEKVIYKYVTVAGEVKEPCTLKVPVGTSFKKLIELAKGTTIDNYVVLQGGPMTGSFVSENKVVTKTTKAIIILPDDHVLVRMKEGSMSTIIKRAMSACSQCRMCTDLCPRRLLGHSIQPHKIMNVVANGITNDVATYMSALACSECGVCETYACHQNLSPRRLIAELKVKLRQNGVKNINAEENPKADLMREGRKVPIERVVSRIDLSKYLVKAPLKEDVDSINKVEIYLQQHVGAPTEAKVKIGDIVKKGDLISETPKDKLGIAIHSSISGVVTYVDSRSIVIETRGDI